MITCIDINLDPFIKKETALFIEMKRPNFSLKDSLKRRFSIRKCTTLLSFLLNILSASIKEDFDCCSYKDNFGIEKSGKPILVHQERRNG